MAYTKEFNINTPLGSENPKQGDDRIRDHKYAIMERLARDHHFSDQDGSEFNPPSPTGVIGLHKRVILTERSSDESTDVNQGAIYAKEVSGSTELFIRGEDDATARQLTSGGMQSIDIPKDTVVLFEADTAVAGYTLLTDHDDKLVYITKGSAAGGENGATNKSGGTWTQPNHTHTQPTHTHTGPSHNHKWYDFINSSTAGKTYDAGGSPVAISGQTQNWNLAKLWVATTPFDPISTYGLDDAWTSMSGTGNTGSSGGDTTGSSATANTWRPTGRNFTRQRRN